MFSISAGSFAVRCFPLSLSLLLIFGCAPLAKLVVGKRGMEIPQIVAYLEPLLKDNRIAVSGKIVIQNPTESALDMEKIFLEIRDEEGVLLEKAELDWERPSVTSRQELEAPVAVSLGMGVLKKKSVSVLLRTGFTYKAFGLHIPIESKVAELQLGALKETIARPLYVNIFSKLRSSLFGKFSLEFTLEITNPLSIDLALEEGVISICTQDGRDIVKGNLPATLFAGAQPNQLKGSIKIGNVWGKLVRSELVKRNPLQFQVAGNLKVPDTDIVIPFKIASALKASFSFF
jgi:hypothetical protein